MKLFSKMEIHTDRQIEADFAKFICLIGLVLVHCFETLVVFSETQSTLQYIFVCVLDYIFGAATFMFCMGFGIAYSRHAQPSQLMKRGIKIFLFGYLLNVFCALPNLILFRNVRHFFFSLWELDILQFAGLALLLFGFLKLLKLPDWGIGLAALALSGFGSCIYALDFENHALNLFLGLFVGTFDYQLATCGLFPLCNWFIFVAAGYLFAKLLRRCESKVKLYLCFSGVSAIIVAAYMLIAIPRGLGMMGSLLHFHHMKTPEAFICIAAAVFALGVYYAIAYVLPSGAKSLFTRVSRNINTIYCLQWFVISWVEAILLRIGHAGLSDGQTLLFGGIIFLFCAVTARFYSDWKIRRKG